MKRFAIVIAVIIAVLGAVIVAAFLLIGNAWERRTEERDARALADLPQRPIDQMLRMQDGTPDLVVFEDGSDGWFELDTTAMPRNLQIGFHGPRFFDVMMGNDHVPLYCTGSGKIIWAVRGGQITDDFAFCSARRMDLAPLRPFASPVEMITEHRSRVEIEALMPEIATDPTRALIARPYNMSRYSQRIALTPPLMWFTYGDGPQRHEVEAAITAAIQAHLGAAEVAFRRRPATNPNLALPPEEVNGSSAGGGNMVMQQDGGYIVLPGVWAEPYEIWIECQPEACDLVQTLNLDAIFAQGRDFSGLNRALALVTVPPRMEAPSPIEAFPSIADLEDETVHIASPVPVTYQIRYIERP